MHLTLTITRGPGQGQWKTFDGQGGTIGRGAGNDWVLPDPERFLSSHHAAIYCEDQSFFLADTSTNGVFVNGAREALGSGRVVPLNMGDRLILGEYELSVTDISTESAAQAGRTAQTAAAVLGGSVAGSILADFANPGDEILDPLQLLNSPAPTVAPSPAPLPIEAGPGWGFGNASNPPQMDGRVVGGTLDPLELLGDPAFSGQSHVPGIPEFDSGLARRNELPESDHSSLLNDHFTPPRSRPEVIPEDWDLNEAPEAETSPVPFTAATGAPPATPDSGLESLLFGDEQHGQVPESAGSEAAFVTSQQLAAVTTEAPAEPTRSSPPAAPAQVATDALRQFLEGAGLDPSLASRLEESGSLQLIGQIFRQFVEGLSEVLVARAQFKSALRLDMTVIAPSGNNPLKFSAGGTDEALEKLLFNRGKGYQGALEAVSEGFQNIKDHDVALISGLRASFAALLHRFDPDDIEERLGKSGILGLLNNRKAQCWDAYVEEFRSVKKLSDNDFEAFFKEAFAEAYEAQIDRLTDPKR